MKMRKVLISLMVVVALLLLPTVALADTSQQVTVTATPSYIAISNAPGTYDFSVITAGGTPNTGTGHFTITNNSSITINITIVCNGWSGAGNSWTYGAAGADTAQLKASDGDGAYDVTVDDTTPAALASSVGVSTNPTWELQLDAPTSFTYGDEQTTTVTVTASAA